MIEAKGAIEVFEPEPVATGILNQHGRPLYRVMPPIGFVHHREDHR
jgi:hypothetical protein